jgi:glucose 1-dehydrogenase
MNDLTGKRVIVTGGNQGIGKAIAQHARKAGAKVAINYLHQPEQAWTLVDELGREHSIAVEADVRDEHAVKRMVDEVVSAFGGVDVLVNNAGCESTHAALDLQMAEWDRVIDTNLRGSFICAQAVGRVMRGQGTGGVIVNISSMHETVPRLGLTHYCISKAGLAMLTKSLALEWAEYGIRVVSVAPGAIETDMNRLEIAAFGKEKFEEWIPAGRLGTVDDVAPAVVFLASDAASYISGSTLRIDGTYLMNHTRYDPRKGAHE